MASRRPHLSVVHSSDECAIPGCALRATAAGLCGSCLAVYATAEALYRRLVARDMARLEVRTPGVGRAAMAALQQRLAELDPPLCHVGSAETQGWAPGEWELDRLDAFLTELRGAAAVPAGESA